MIFGELVFIPILLMVYLAINKRRVEHYKMLPWIILPTLLLSIPEVKRPNYIAIISPALFMITAYSLFFFMKFALLQYLWRKRIIKYVGILIVALPIRYSYERIKFFTPVSTERTKFLELLDLKGLEAHNQDSTIIIDEHYNIELMYYHGFTAYGHGITDSERNKLTNEGITVLRRIDNQIVTDN